MQDKSETVVPFPSLLRSANDLRREAKFCDIVLYVQSKRGVMVGYPAHKLVLINASRYFKGLLEREDSNNHCHFPSLTEDGLFMLLDIIYGRTISNEANIEDALYAAKYLQVEPAIEYLERKLTDRIHQQMPQKTIARSISTDNQCSDSEISVVQSNHRVTPSNVLPHSVQQGNSVQSLQGNQGNEASEPVLIKVESDDEEYYNQSHSLPDQQYEGMAPGGTDSRHSFESAGTSQESSMLQSYRYISEGSESLDIGESMGSVGHSVNQFGLLSCRVCGLQFDKQVDLISHMKSHKHTDLQARGGRIHTCRICQKQFSRKDVLRDHYRTHTGAKPYVCEACGRQFSKASHVRSHCFSVHGYKVSNVQLKQHLEIPILD